MAECYVKHRRQEASSDRWERKQAKNVIPRINLAWTSNAIITPRYLQQQAPLISCSKLYVLQSLLS